MGPRVGLVTPCRNRREKTTRFLECLRRQTYPHTIYLVDSNSSDGTPETVRRCYPEVVLMHGDDSKFWTGATNIGIRRALADGCELIVTINDDSMIDPEWLSGMVAESRRGNYDILASRIDFLGQPGLIWALGAFNDWPTARLFQLPENEQWFDECAELASGKATVEVQTLCGNGVMFHRRVFERAGLYNEKWTPHYHADSEFVLRARKYGFTPYVNTRTVLKNDVHNDSAVPAPAETPPVVKSGDFRSFLDRVRFDSRKLFLSIRSDLYWRALLYYVVQHCPRRHLISCLRNLIRMLWKRHFEGQWKAYKADSQETRAFVQLWPGKLARSRAHAWRGELTMDAVDALDATPDHMFIPVAYDWILGRMPDPSASGFDATVREPGGRDRLMRLLSGSLEARLTGIEKRTTALAKRMVELRTRPVPARHVQHIPEDVDELAVLEGEELVDAAYRRLLSRVPETAVVASQTEAAGRDPDAFVGSILSSAEYSIAKSRSTSPLLSRWAESARRGR